MTSASQTGDYWSAWSEVQRNWWGGWFDFMGGVALSPGKQAADVWQSSFEVWKRSVEMTLEAQQGVTRILGTESEPLDAQARDLAFRKELLQNEYAAGLIAEARPKLELGASASISKTISEADIVAFAELSGDVNPIHLDDSYAVKTRFGKRIAHGMLAAGLISAILGTKLPGPGAIYLSQNLKFRAPVSIGDEVTATVTVASQKEGKPLYTLDTVCKNQDGVTVLEGEAVILFEPVV